MHDFFQKSAMGFFCPMLFWVPYMFLNMEQRFAKMGIFDFLLGTIGHMYSRIIHPTSKNLKKTQQGTQKIFQKNLILGLWRGQNTSKIYSRKLKIELHVHVTFVKPPNNF